MDLSMFDYVGDELYTLADGMANVSSDDPGAVAMCVKQIRDRVLKQVEHLNEVIATLNQRGYETP